MESIKLKKSNILKFGIQTEDGVDTGNYLEFDLEDIELPIRLQECLERHKKNEQFIRNQFIIINKRQDRKGKKLYSANEEAKIKAMQEYYKKEIECLDLFLGVGGTEKMLNGRKPYYTMFDDINEALEPILPKITEKTMSIEQRIKEKYAKKENDVME